MLLVTSDNRLDHFLVEAKNQQPSISHVGHCSMCTKFHVYCHPGSPIRNRGWRQLCQDPGFGARVPTANFVFQQRGIETAGLIHFGEICGNTRSPLWQLQWAIYSAAPSPKAGDNRGSRLESVRLSNEHHSMHPNFISSWESHPVARRARRISGEG